MFGKTMTFRAAAVAALLLLPAQFAVAKSTNPATDKPSCCATHTRCCKTAKYCCDQPDKAECCKKGVDCCGKKPCCGANKKAKKAACNVTGMPRKACCPTKAAPMPPCCMETCETPTHA